MPPRQQQQDQWTFLDHYRFAQWLIQFPALTIMVIMRRDMGFRAVRPLALFCTNALVIMVSAFAYQETEDKTVFALTILALLSILYGMVQRFRRWLQLSKYELQNSVYIGTSPFEFRWLPSFLKRYRRLERFADPVFCFLCALAAFPFAHVLSVWLAIVSISLRMFEYQTWIAHRDRMLDNVDGMISAQGQGENLERYERGQDFGNAGVATRPLSTGLGDDVRQKLKRRKP